MIRNIFVIVFFLLHGLAFGQKISFKMSERLILGNYKERSASVSAGDVDGDGDMDVLVANGRHWPGQNRILINNGKGIFTVSKPLGIESATSYAAELADLDQDGDLDVVVGNDMAPNSIFINVGEGEFVKAASFGTRYAPTRNITVSDIDMDGDLDILITNRGRENEICLKEESGGF